MICIAMLCYTRAVADTYWTMQHGNNSAMSKLLNNIAPTGSDFGLAPLAPLFLVQVCCCTVVQNALQITTTSLCTCTV
jgi:hypothetical protein